MTRPRATFARVSSLLATSRQPVYAVDAERCVCFVNPACATWLGRTEQELLGQTCDYTPPTDGSEPSSPSSGSGSGGATHTAGTDVAATLSGLCPPPELFAEEVDRTFRLVVPQPGGGWSHRRARGVRLETGEIAAPLVLVFVAAEESTTATDETDGRGRNKASSAEWHDALREKLGREYRLASVVGQSPALRRVHRQAELAIAAQCDALVIGPQGSGREHLCRVIHYGWAATHQGGLLLPIECQAFTAELLQREVLGLVRRQRETAAEAVATLLLLSLDRLPAEAQWELGGLLKLPGIALRVLATAAGPLDSLAAGDSGATEPASPVAEGGRGLANRGGARRAKRDTASEGTAARFRPDLAARLSTLVIEIPPLAERMEDVPLLAQYFLERQNALAERQLSGFTSEAMDRLCAYGWPGEVQQLLEIVTLACQACGGVQVGLSDLPAQFREAELADRIGRRESQPLVLDAFLAEAEVELLQRALRRAQGNKTKAAELLGISRPRLHRRLLQLGLVSPAAPDTDDDPPVFEQV